MAISVRRKSSHTRCVPSMGAVPTLSSGGQGRTHAPHPARRLPPSPHSADSRRRCRSRHARAGRHRAFSGPGSRGRRTLGPRVERLARRQPRLRDRLPGDHALGTPGLRVPNRSLRKSRSDSLGLRSTAPKSPPRNVNPPRAMVRLPQAIVNRTLAERAAGRGLVADRKGTAVRAVAVIRRSKVRTQAHPSLPGHLNVIPPGRLFALAVRTADLPRDCRSDGRSRPYGPADRPSWSSSIRLR